MKEVIEIPGFSFRPIPAALLSFCTPLGEPRVLATGWVGMICTRPATLSVSLQQPVPAELLSAECFNVNLPSAEMLAYCDPAYLQGGPVAAGLSMQRGAAHDGPLIAECPVRIECRRLESSSRFGQELLRGTILAVHLGDKVFGLDNTPLDLGRLKPFTRCPNLPRIVFPAQRETSQLH